VEINYYFMTAVCMRIDFLYLKESLLTTISEFDFKTTELETLMAVCSFESLNEGNETKLRF